MIHIVFEEANIEALQKSFTLDPSLQGAVISIDDDYAVGPIGNLFSDEGIENRRLWWKDILTGGPFEGSAGDGHVNDPRKVADIKEKLAENPEEIIWIWAAQNKHDVSGYYWLMSQFKDFQSRIFILYLNNLPFINEKGSIFYPTNLFQIQPKEFLKAKKLARPITLSEFEVDPDEWTKMGTEDKGVRLLEGGKKLVQHGHDFYDTEILKFVTKDWQKLNRFFTQYYGKAKETTADAYIIWRLQKLAEQEMIELQGNVKNIKETEVRLKASE